MRLTKFTWLLVAVVTIIYTATLVIVRVENPRHIRVLSALAVGLRH